VAGKGAKPIKVKPYVSGKQAHIQPDLSEQEPSQTHSSHPQPSYSQPSHPQHGNTQPKIFIKILGRHFSVFNEKYLRYHLEYLSAVVKSGNFSQDAVGDWYVNLVVEIERHRYQTVHLQQKKAFQWWLPMKLSALIPNARPCLF